VAPPITEVATKISICLGVGILVGLERAWAHKKVGVRTLVWLRGGPEVGFEEINRPNGSLGCVR
jgi:hypothetical protein